MYGLRPLRLGEILDAAIKITKTNPGRTFGLAAATFSGLAVVQWLDLLSVDLSSSTTPSWWGLLFAGTGRESPLYWMAVVAGLTVLKPFVYDTVHHALVGTPLSETRDLMALVPRLAVSGALYALATAVATLFFVVPGFVIAIVGAVSQPSIVNERQGAVAALRRSLALVRTDLGRVAGFSATVWAFRVLAGLAIAWALPGVLPYTLQPNSTRLLAVTLTVIIATLVWPVTLAARAILFTDLRVRAESLDVDLMIAGITNTTDARRRWAPR